jgi:hypothetical protein
MCQPKKNQVSIEPLGGPRCAVVGNGAAHRARPGPGGAEFTAGVTPASTPDTGRALAPARPALAYDQRCTGQSGRALQPPGLPDDPLHERRAAPGEGRIRYRMKEISIPRRAGGSGRFSRSHGWETTPRSESGHLVGYHPPVSRHMVASGAEPPIESESHDEIGRRTHHGQSDSAFRRDAAAARSDRRRIGRREPAALVGRHPPAHVVLLRRLPQRQLHRRSGHRLSLGEGPSRHPPLQQDASAHRCAPRLPRRL